MRPDVADAETVDGSRSNPDGYAVTAACIAPEHIKSLTVKQFDGKNWEQSFTTTGIGGLSK